MSERGASFESPEHRFTKLFTDCYEPVLAFTRRRVGPDLAQDIVAETFLTAWRHVDDLRGEPLPWLYRVAGHAIANQRRGATRRRRLDDRARLLTSEATSTDHADAVAEASKLCRGFRIPERTGSGGPAAADMGAVGPHRRGVRARLLAGRLQGPAASRPSPALPAAERGRRRAGPRAIAWGGHPVEGDLVMHDIDRRLAEAGPDQAQDVRRRGVITRRRYPAPAHPRRTGGRHSEESLPTAPARVAGGRGGGRDRRGHRRGLGRVRRVSTRNGHDRAVRDQRRRHDHRFDHRRPCLRLCSHVATDTGQPAPKPPALQGLQMSARSSVLPSTQVPPHCRIHSSRQKRPGPEADPAPGGPG